MGRQVCGYIKGIRHYFFSVLDAQASGARNIYVMGTPVPADCFREGV